MPMLHGMPRHGRTALLCHSAREGLRLSGCVHCAVLCVHCAGFLFFGAARPFRLCRPVRRRSRRQRSVHECEAAGTVIQLTEQLDIDLSKKWKERERQSRAVSPEWHGIEWPLVLSLRLYARSRQYSLSSRHCFAAVHCTLRSSLSSWTSVCAKALTALPLVSLSARVHPCL